MLRSLCRMRSAILCGVVVCLVSPALAQQSANPADPPAENPDSAADPDQATESVDLTTKQNLLADKYRRLEDLIGRVDLLGLEEGNTSRQSRLDLSPIVSDAGLAKDAPQFCTDLRNEPFDKGGPGSGEPT